MSPNPAENRHTLIRALMLDAHHLLSIIMLGVVVLLMAAILTPGGVL